MALCIALEGLMRSGKTSLLRALATRFDLFAVPEYTDLPDGLQPQQLRTPRSPEDAARAREHFLVLERRRCAPARLSQGPIVLDRSALSILAFDFALQATSGVECFEDARRDVATADWVWPDICVYLAIDFSTIEGRRKPGSVADDRPLLQRSFNQSLTEFYEKVIPELWPELELIVIDGSKPADAVMQATVARLTKLGAALQARPAR